MKHWKFILASSGVVAALALLSLFVAEQRNGGIPADASFPFRILAARPQQMFTLPAGTRIHVRLEGILSTEKNSPGDPFSVSLDAPLMTEGKIRVPSKSKIQGQLTKVEKFDRVNGRATLTMVLQKIMLNGKQYNLETYPLTLEGRSILEENTANGLANSRGVFPENGLASNGAPIAYGPETRFTFTLSRPLEIPVYKG